MHREKSPAELLLFAYCKIKETAERKNKDMEELYCKISTRQQNVNIGHQGQGDNMENREQQEIGRNK